MNKESELLRIRQKRPATCAASTRCDLRTLASLAQFWLEQGEPARTMSDLIRLSLESFLKVLVVNGKAQHVELAEAQRLIERLGLQHRTNARFIHELQLDGLMADPIQRAPEPSPEALASLHKSQVEDLAEAQRRREMEMAQQRQALSFIPTPITESEKDD